MERSGFPETTKSYLMPIIVEFGTLLPQIQFRFQLSLVVVIWLLMQGVAEVVLES